MRSLRIVLLLTGVAMALGAPAAALQGAATTFTVTKTADTNDGTCDADCSLREAITDANANAGTDTIAFAIPGAGPHTIQPTSALPTITDPVIIDGYTQPGASANTNSVASGLGLNTVLKIELDGTNAGALVTGLFITGGGSIVKGLVIHSFSSDGILIRGAGGNAIVGNFVGTDVSGAIDKGNAGPLGGITISGSANHIVGGTEPSARNLISGNDTEGGVAIVGTNTTGNRVQGNLIGTDASGTATLGNAGAGVTVGGPSASDNTIGGTTSGTRNVISGNNFGVVIQGTTATGNIVEGNFIGTDVTGMVDLGNTFDGVFIGSESTNNTIGGTLSGAGNTIAFNNRHGVFVTSGSGNNIFRNAVFSNSSLGIDLGTSGVTPNDAGDGDAGANNLQNFPVLTSAVTGGGTGVTVAGTLDSAASAAFRVEFFSNTACDPSGNGEGETFLGATTATTDGSGTAVFVVGLTKAVSPGAFITATATDPANNTSEFSACQTAVAAAAVPGIGGPWLAGLAALLAAAFAWTAYRRARVTAPAR